MRHAKNRNNEGQRGGGVRGPGTGGLTLTAVAIILALPFGVATAHTGAAPEQAAGQDTRAVAPEAQAVARARAAAHGVAQSSYRAAAAGAQLPQDIRIMQRIVSTALGEVEPPELPDVLQQQAGSSGATSGYVSYAIGAQGVVWSPSSGSRSRVLLIGDRDVTGFYMQGYGYLFTVEWRVGPRGIPGFGGSAADFGRRVSELNELMGAARRAAAAGQPEESRAAGEAERALEQERQRVEERQAAWDEWAAEYRSRLAEALRDVVALYGSTLSRAQPDEAITFIADFGGGESETVTVSARRDQLSGANREQNLAAVRMAKGETDVSDALRTQLKIMAEIIDTALQLDVPGEIWGIQAAQSIRYYGGDSTYRYVPGYGVLFRKTARLNLATRVIRDVAPSRLAPGAAVQSLRQQVEETSEEQRQAYAEHLADLKQRTAEMLATYGPTLTELQDDDWVGVYYNVGSAAGLLEGGITDFLVQARMGDIRQAGRQADGAGWLLDRLVTNERQDSEPASR